jgi:hypothetical protein
VGMFCCGLGQTDTPPPLLLGAAVTATVAG